MCSPSPPLVDDAENAEQLERECRCDLGCLSGHHDADRGAMLGIFRAGHCARPPTVLGKPPFRQEFGATWFERRYRISMVTPAASVAAFWL